MTRLSLIIGCGDVGKRVAKQLMQIRQPVIAASHSEESRNTLKQLGIDSVFADLDEIDSLKLLPAEATQIYYFAPPPSDGEVDSRMTNFLASLKLSNSKTRIIYISTTGVYGDHQGEWIDESTPTTAPSNRSKRRLNAETRLIRFCEQKNCEYIILRVGGIYCLPKLPLQRLQSGVKILKANIAPASNRIHANDLANICITAMNSQHVNEIYNACDGNPTSISDYFIQVAKIFHLPAPEEIDWDQANKDISPAMMSYLQESKKIKIDKLLQQLEIQFKYPDLDSGLKQCLEEANANNSD